MKTELNYKEVAFILNKSDDYAIAIIAKHKNVPLPTYKERTNKKQITAYKYNFRIAYKINVDDLSVVTGLNVRHLIEDVDRNFLKNQTCTDYLMQKCREKMKPNKLGFMPEAITIPPEITCFMSQKSIETVVEWLKINFMDTVNFRVKAA